MKAEVWDVAVIGGGAAGMMAAAQAARAGARVVLVEKNSSLGKKLLISGGGRCNLTNAEPDTRVFLSKFNSKERAADKFLFSPFSRHGVSDSLSYFHAQGMETKVERNNRVFPASDSAQSVWDALHRDLTSHAVQIRTGSEVKSITAERSSIAYVTLRNDQRIYAKAFIFATGGLSRPDTGSTGDGFNWLLQLGHTIARPDPSLVPLTLRDAWVPALSGLSLPFITLSLVEDGKKVAKQTGGLVFTHKGISGPATLNLSKDVGERLPYGPVTLSLDLLPELSMEKIDSLLQETIRSESNKKIRNILGNLAPSALAPIILSQAEVSEDTPAHSVTREERLRLVKAFKEMPLHVKGRLGFDKAIIASGGVPLTEIDMRSMRSKVISNLFIVGDLLNIDRPSGGYSLQLCWTTGFVAGVSAAEFAKENGRSDRS